MELVKCTNCSRAPQPVDQFVSKTDPSKRVRRCLKCREKDDRQKRKCDVREKRNERGRDRKYYVKYREKKRSEDERSFLERNANVMRAWRDRHPGYQSHLAKTVLSVRTSILKSSSKARRIPIYLDDETIEALVLSDCAYCGKTSEPGDFNGIDRLDASGMYGVDNVVGCCKMCNYMKGSLDPITFVRRCEHISGECEYAYIWPKSGDSNFSSYRKRARDKNLEFGISKDFFEHTRIGRCHYCKRTPEIDEKFGVDRLDNSVGYTEDNCVTACSECNYMKRSFGEREFFEQCAKIARFTKDNEFVYTGNRCFDSIMKRERIM
jgi:glutaredoxin